MTVKTLVTSALPYANGPIHLGHIVEHVLSDIFVRYLRSRGDQVVFLCADDTHGAAIELASAKQGVTPEQFIERMAVEHRRDLADFGISYDSYGSTNSKENRHFAELIYTRAKEAGSIGRREVEQAWDRKTGRFLADRYIRGTCPNCRATDQYGDACEVCNSTYSPRELIDARSALSGEPLEWKKSEHLFFLLSKHTELLKKVIADPTFMSRGPAAQLGQFFDKGLNDWDISRDGPYFGFPIPGEQNKYFYVWLDAPIGYISMVETWATQTGLASGALEYWARGASTRIVHVIGKDIVYFHCLFWPAVLEVAGLKRPDSVHIHGHLTVNGEKMSKSRGTFINARAYLDLLDPAYLRYYYASLLGPGPDDLDFNLSEFRQRVNAELVNNLGNLANRVLSLLARPEFGGRLAEPTPELGERLVTSALGRVGEIGQAFERFDPRSAVKAILEVGFAGNQFLTAHEPWKRVKTAPEEARAVLSEAAEVVALLCGLLEPIVPTVSDALALQLGRPRLTFQQLAQARYPLLDRSIPIGTPAPLIARLEEEQVAKLIAPAGQSAVPPAASSSSGGAAGRAFPPAASSAPPAEIEYQDFARLALRVGRVVLARTVPKADKLLELQIDLGEPSPRTIVSGIAEAYTPEQLVGKRVVVVANLKPRKLKGIESRGMVLTAGRGGRDLVLLDPGDLPPGTEVT